MATTKNIIYTDDLDGSRNAVPIEFGLDGKIYRIDLSPKNVRALRKTYGPYVSAARKVPAQPTGKKPAPTKSISSAIPRHGYDPRVVREWAAQNGQPIATRGRIPFEVLEAWHSRQITNAG